MGGGAGGDDGQRERQPRAALDDVGDRVRIGRPRPYRGAIPGDEATVTIRENNPVGGNWLARARLHCAR
ncbi:hypothetical protein [Virgisporangium aurantiacum]|uniref:Uncharacterized protein n=1 Tax=Virgisporangium aurantiacum TaxID=175570 RepID=A0A8J4E6R5_9ACTN|nr:hypothetical protein [Virgisporangium aurantiacum]GIJ63504.1 hypothetical protein Vau01_110200 [Virgisporangium aurantiacum]